MNRLRLTLATLAALLMLTPATAALVAAPAPAVDVPVLPDLPVDEPIVDVDGRYIVSFHEMIDTSEGTYAGARIVDEWAPLSFVTVQVDDLALFEARLKTDENVRYYEPEGLMHASYTPNDPFWQKNDYTWGQWEIWADVAWDRTRGSTSVKVCVIDTGLRKTHEEFAGQSRIARGYDFVYEDTNPNDPNGHGTHVAGIVGATINNAKGIPGMAQSTIIPIRVLNAEGSGTNTDIAQGIDYCRQQGAHIASMSLGGGYSSTVANAVSAYQNGGGLAIAAVGNDGCGCARYPAALSGVMGVGAVDKNLNRASFSNYGSFVDIAAPGVRIVSTYKNSDTSYVYLDGTSMATPFVSGTAALVKSYNTGFSASNIANRIYSTAQDLGASGKDDYYGYGLVRADRAVG